MGPVIFALALFTCLQNAHGCAIDDGEDRLALAARPAPGSTHDKVATSLSSDHMHVSQEDISNLICEHIFLQLQCGGLGAPQRSIELSISTDALVKRTLTHLLARSKPSRTPISLDLEFHHEELAGAVLPYLCAQREEEPFRLTHLGLDAGVLSSLSQNPEVARALTPNASLTRLRLYGVLDTCDFLTLFPHLTYLDASSVTISDEKAGTLVDKIQGMTSLRSFTAPNSEMQEVTQSIFQALGLCPPSSTHLAALKQIEENLRQAARPSPQLGKSQAR
ncbi:MAG: hypothetical protein C0514_01630 [Candidatus Puniceispirillum sp.]|nr:hypothetical protein [Candidatus Puniceispirillum sp.]